MTFIAAATTSTTLYFCSTSQYLWQLLQMNLGSQKNKLFALMKQHF